MAKLKDYHWIWLDTHPNRTEEWLCRQMAEGFHIHHIDGNSENNDPKNLVLIEKADHMKLHGLDLYRMARRVNSGKAKQKSGFRRRVTWERITDEI